MKTISTALAEPERSWPMTEEEYSRTHRLRESEERAHTLLAMHSDRYGDRGFWHERDGFASETAAEIGQLMQKVSDVIFAAENSCQGGLELACYDVFGENWREAACMIIDLYHLDTRDGQPAAFPAFVKLAVQAILLDWKAHAEEPGATDIVQMVRDALAGRTEIPDDILLPAIAYAMQEVMLDA